MPIKPIIIGIDGGASKVSAHLIECKKDSFTLAEQFSTKEYKKNSDFQSDFSPVALKTQLAQIQNGNIELTKEEKNQAEAYYSAFIDSIAEIYKSTIRKKVLIGLGMPGIKSTDGRGIIVMANGPRMPNFATEIEKRLASIGIALAAPIYKIGSDADYCGIGEEFSDGGAFKNVKNAYYLGGGTGTADAIKLHGNLVTFDECKRWIAKTWELKSEDGKSMETYCSANGIQSIYSELSGKRQAELINKNIYTDKILNKAADGERSAITTWEVVVNNLSKLLFERIVTIYSGWQNNFTFLDKSKKDLEKGHPFLGTVLDRIVIGQRLGNLLKNELAEQLIIDPLLKYLGELINISDSLDDSARSHYIKNGKLNSEIIVSSSLKEASALGAGIDAWKNYANRK